MHDQWFNSATIPTHFTKPARGTHSQPTLNRNAACRFFDPKKETASLTHFVIKIQTYFSLSPFLKEPYQSVQQLSIEGATTRWPPKIPVQKSLDKIS